MALNTVDSIPKRSHRTYSTDFLIGEPLTAIVDPPTVPEKVGILEVGVGRKNT